MNILKTEITNSESETEELAARLAKKLSMGTVVALYGNLGAGKTVFSRGIARGLGVSEPVASPTFTIVQEYPLSSNQWLFHLDLYRINDAEAALVFGIDEYLDNPSAILVIEWPERIEELLPKNTLKISIERDGEEVRKINLPELGLQQ